MRHATLSVVVLFLASPLAAQTNDHFFRSWAWETAASGPRSTGLAGAMVAFPDDASSLLSNPAALASLTKTEISGGLVNRGTDRAAVGDTYTSSTGLDLVVAAHPFFSRGALAAFVTEPYASRVELDGSPLPDGLSDVGRLEGTVDEAGLAFGWRAAGFLHIGARIAAARLALDGEYSRQAGAAPASMRVTTGGTSTRATGGFGVVLVPARRLRLAVAFSERVRWPLTRRATSPALGVVLDDGSKYEVRRPRVVSAGVWLQPSLKLALMAQADWVSYGDLARGVAIFEGAHTREEYALEDTWEGRAGVELSIPLRNLSVQCRAGVLSQAPGTLRYVGTDPVEAAAFRGGKRETPASVGASLITARSLRFDLSARFGGRRTLLTAGAAVRF